jgi:hypothetical protein
LIFFLYKNPPLLDLPQYKNLKKSKKNSLTNMLLINLLIIASFMLYKTGDPKKNRVVFKKMKNPGLDA